MFEAQQQAVTLSDAQIIGWKPHWVTPIVLPGVIFSMTTDHTGQTSPADGTADLAWLDCTFRGLSDTKTHAAVTQSVATPANRHRWA